MIRYHKTNKTNILITITISRYLFYFSLHPGWLSSSAETVRFSANDRQINKRITFDWSKRFSAFVVTNIDYFGFRNVLSYPIYCGIFTGFVGEKTNGFYRFLHISELKTATKIIKKKCRKWENKIFEKKLRETH